MQTLTVNCNPKSALPYHFEMFNNQVLFLFKAIDEHLKWLISEAGSKYFAMDMLYHSNKRIGSDSVHRCCNHFQWFLRCWSCYKQM
ncbi:hypothetical protein T03_11796 [Trichinella britovi]|uniref:Uncharacterized protein n=1 Tax=Trichinella britovi TaxID=45882 RepID=A0A0V1C7N5_TRIBR|nr:hypothetical protein T03_11796 [Trichinella britovi]